MPISAATIAAYAPWGNAELAFKVGTGTAAADPETGNVVQPTETLEYLAALTIEAPDWEAKLGVDITAYRCTGRLLSPAVLDPRITNGAQAQARINGYLGRFELVFDLAMDALHRRDLRQAIQGTFRLMGGAG
jgi:hypothetical protein